MKYWKIVRNELILNHEVIISGHISDYSYNIPSKKHGKRAIWLLEEDEYLSIEEKAEAVKYIKEAVISESK